MAALASVLTFLAQRGYGAVVSLTRFPFAAGVGNAAIAYVAYLGMTLWPAHLAVLHRARAPEPSTVLFAVLILAAITLAAWLGLKRRPYIAVGWLWYLGMLVPVIGFVQVGSQTMTNRYTYVPMVGLSLAFIWTVADLLHKRPAPRTAGMAATLSVLVLLAGRHIGKSAIGKTAAGYSNIHSPSLGTTVSFRMIWE